MYKIGEVVKIRIVDYSDGFGFKTACSKARCEALDIFGVNMDGHLANVVGSDRSSCSIVVTFSTVEMRGSMMGWDTVYEFNAVVEKNDDPSQE